MSASDHDLRLRGFWRRIRDGIEVGVDRRDSASLLGVRDGFSSYFERAFDADVAITVTPLGSEPGGSALPSSDEEMIELVVAGVSRLRSGPGAAYSFCASSVSGLHSVFSASAPEGRFFVRTWVALDGPQGLTVGSSGALELPPELFAAAESGSRIAVPGKRRRGGMQSSLTAGLESRRTATAQATLHCLATMLYSVLESGRTGPRERVF